MGYFRLFRRVRLAPGVTLNLAKRGPSLSLGVRGAHVTFGRSGIRRTVGLPGTGVFYTSRRGWHSGVHSAPGFHEDSEAQQAGSNALLAAVIVIVVILILAALASR